MIYLLIELFSKMLNMFAVIGAGQAEFDEVYSSSMVSEANERWAALYKNLAIWTGQEQSFTDFQDADYIYDTFVHQKLLIENFTFPDWASKEVIRQLIEMHRMKFAIFTATEQIKRLTVGVFLNELTEKISKAIRPTPKREQYVDTDDLGDVKKVNIYMTHDIFLFNLLVDLGIPNGRIPPFGSAIIFELYIDEAAESNFEESSSVRILYLNESLNETFIEFKTNPLHLSAYPQKGNEYTVKEFLSSFASLLISEAEADRACKGDRSVVGSSNSVAYISVIVIESIVILLFVALSFKKCRRSVNALRS